MHPGAQIPLLGASDIFWILRLVLSAIAGGVIGLNRHQAGKPAGVKTHAMVAFGAALFARVASSDAGPVASDTIARIIPGIATGVGFLGAGEIFRDATRGNQVSGLTSAASLWATAGLGLIVSYCSLALSIATVVLILLIMTVAAQVERPKDPGQPG